MKESSSCRIEITRLSLSPFPLCQITTGTRGEKRRDRSRANGNSRKLSSVKIRNSPKALTPIPSPFFLQTRTTFIVKRARARTEDRTSCNHITDSSNGHPRREEKRREEEGARWMLDPVLKPERRLPRIEITANGSTWQRESRRSPAVRGGGRKKKRVAGNSFSMTKPYIGGGAIYRKSLATSD